MLMLLYLSASIGTFVLLYATFKNDGCLDDKEIAETAWVSAITLSIFAPLGLSVVVSYWAYVIYRKIMMWGM